MVSTKNESYRAIAGSADLVTAKMRNIRTRTWMAPSDIATITQRITNAKTGEVSARQLDAAEVVTNALTTTPLPVLGPAEHNIMVLVLATELPTKGRYHYQLEVVPKDSEGEPAPQWTTRTDEIDIIAD